MKALHTAHAARISSPLRSALKRQLAFRRGTTMNLVLLLHWVLIQLSVLFRSSFTYSYSHLSFNVLFFLYFNLTWITLRTRYLPELNIATMDQGESNSILEKMNISFISAESADCYHLRQRFIQVYPVEQWKEEGFFVDEDIMDIHCHWLQFEPVRPSVHFTLAVIYAIIFVIGFLSNALVIYVIVRYFYTRRCSSLNSCSNHFRFVHRTSPFAILVIITNINWGIDFLSDWNE